MCYAVTCPACGKTTWDGCGSHVDSVLRSVPVAQRCSCPKKITTADGTGFFGRILRR
ncbi:hypothetical protein [Nocardia asteroides]|uniref:Uncharacterized protein n=1 Tax=Nocardia asteroides NBRC 15531 TaxID=1110697 RepID=U5EJ15_NOCAS|nr:hypothetical protein [Nocardia asteroides]UGT51650.1 hypothetical protein LT345_14335 [Nocardia asteroides]GAD86391.1 hypothetical protein NCAST_32_08780 [Nocardia asteroides NBRC 15531]SFM20596.1 hypothetical protein SAMN05444423_102231 [Nocardia asteroides]VEG35448.1 Uncharacterised protein [Nocardia asteroides]